MATKRILLADDNPNDIELAICALEEVGMADEVAVVNDGDEALDYLYRRGPFAERDLGYPIVALLDMKMPKMSGLEVLQEMKSDPVLRTIPVVMLTSSREERDLAQSYKAGVNAYIVKPVDFDKFIGAVKEVASFWGKVNQPPPALAEDHHRA